MTHKIGPKFSNIVALKEYADGLLFTVDIG